MNKEVSRKLAEEICSLPDNVKAEIIIAGLLESGLEQEELQVEYSGAFSRPFRKDVMAAGAFERRNNEYELKIQLSRNGLYDLLPEAVSHVQQLEDGAGNELRSLTEGYRRRKKEEAAARKFYRPLETEIFLQGVRLEREEQALLYNPSAVFNQFLSDFWGMDEEVPLKFRSVLLHLLPYMHSIAGDLEKVNACLENILGLTLFRTLEYRTIEFPSYFNRLGANRLGESLTLGSCVHAVPFLVYTVGPIPQEELIEFLPGGDVNRFLKKFFAYTLPLEVEFELNFLALPYAQKEGGSSFGVLGYSASI